MMSLGTAGQTIPRAAQGGRPVTSMALVHQLGLMELLILFAIIMLLFGWKSLPKLARSMGESVRHFRSGLEGKTTDAIEDGKGTTATAAKPEAPEQVRKP
jgi:sec-independent protein translocase protein TatA